SAASGSSTDPQIDAAGARVVFSSTANLLGTNPEGNPEIFTITSSGAGLSQLTSSVSGASVLPSVSGDGTRVVFASSADLVAGSNPEGNSEIFAINVDGSGLRQLTMTSSGANTGPVLSADGVRITFGS